MAAPTSLMTSYMSSPIANREMDFIRYMTSEGKRKDTIKSYRTNVKNGNVVAIIKGVCSKNSIYDVFSIPNAEEIARQVKGLSIDKTGHGSYSSPIKMYTKFLEFLTKTPAGGSAGTSTPVSSSAPLASSPTPSISTSSVDIETIIQEIKKSGLLYSDDLISRFVISLMTKPFVILSGLAGSGKTQLAIAFAKAMCERKEQYCVVPVGANWTNREPLLGYPNALEEGKYVMPESGVLQLLMKAADDKDHPYFMILDEMNLSYVERYFADFLSAMESHEEIPLWHSDTMGAIEEDGSAEATAVDKGDAGSDKKIPSTIKLPENLFIIGTINVDETTYMFSPKVLDRANVIEFKIDEDDMTTYLDSSVNVEIEKIVGSLSSMAVNFVELSKTPVASGFTDSKDVLLLFFKQLKSVNAEFGYRSASEIGRFIALSRSLKTLDDEKAVDAAIVQKLLPKLHGSRKKLCPVLSALWTICMPAGDAGIDKATGVPATTKYPLAADKILRMYRGATDNGFTSFAEA